MDHTWWDDYGSIVWCVLTIKSSPWWVCRRRKKIGGMIMDHDQGSRLVWCILTIKSSPCWWVCRRRKKTIGGIITKDHDWYDVFWPSNHLFVDEYAGEEEKQLVGSSPRITIGMMCMEVSGGLRSSPRPVCQSPSRQITLDRPHQQCCMIMRIMIIMLLMISISTSTPSPLPSSSLVLQVITREHERW